ncbi:MAG: hypothetical protein EPN86_03105 [Nanoarchaeota archaeon]|nr:MAG: hypothetical protein EPN86_03105 [Nanoarchaeota archaeon]
MTKNVTITDDAYERLKQVKEDNESFTDAILRLTKARKLSDFAGILSADEAENLRESVKKSRRQSQIRAENIRKRLKNDS